MAGFLCVLNKQASLHFIKTSINSAILGCSNFSSVALQDNTYEPHGPIELYKKRISEGLIYPDDNQKKVIDLLQRVYNDIKNYTVPKPTKHLFNFFNSKPAKIQSPHGLYIYGAVGGGKTMLMDLFYETVETHEKKRVHFNAFMLDVHSRIHKLKKRASKEEDSTRPSKFDPIPPVAESIMSECFLLCFDEFQVTDIGDAMILKRLFTELFDHGCIVVATSNRPPDDLYKNGLQRSNFIPFIQILKNHCDVLSLNTGIDYRRKTAESNATGNYFIKAKDSTESPVDNVFKYLISKENDVVRPRVINIMGRNVNFNKSCGQILDTTFQELCERPLGSSDYLMLARTFHTIIIRDIPQIKLRSTASRRFITLIDNLYDNRTRVVMTADAPLEQLFIKDHEDGSEETNVRMLMDDLGISKNSENATASIFTGEEEIFASDRCVSRITEMQTQEYWNKWDKSK